MWIDAKKQPPTKDGKYLVVLEGDLCGDGKYEIAHYCIEWPGDHWVGGGVLPVAYWREIPEFHGRWVKDHWEQ